MKKVVKTRSESNVLPSSSKSVRSNLNESVIDCGIIRKVSAKEKDAMVIKELLKEEDPCDEMFECNFCTKVFASAGPLTAHLVNHCRGNDKNQKLDCPWPLCSFANTHQNMTKHIRSKHTKEELFMCVHCPKKFHTMDTKLVHEKKHTKQDEWDYCDNCLKFFKTARGNCSFCQR